MAKYGVLEHFQDITEQPTDFIPKTAALYRLRKNLADRVSKHVIRMKRLRDVSEIVSEHPQVIEVPSIKPPRRPDWMFTSYPIRDERTCIL